MGKMDQKKKQQSDEEIKLNNINSIKCNSKYENK